MKTARALWTIRLRKSGTRLSHSCRTCGRRFRGRTRELAALAVVYARGLSTRDIEDAFTDETGRRLLSRAAVSEITEKLVAEYEAPCPGRIISLQGGGIIQESLGAIIPL